MPAYDPPPSYHAPESATTAQVGDVRARLEAGRVLMPVGPRQRAQGREAPLLGIPAVFSTTEGASAAPAPEGGREYRGGKSTAAEREAERSAERRKEGAPDRAKRRYELQDTARALLPAEHRIQHCQCTPVGGLVAVLHHPEHGSASFGGLQTCGSFWACPVCASKIGARRAQEVEAGATAWRARGGHLYMLTLTMRHELGRDLGELNQRMIKAWAKMTSGRAWSLFKHRIGLVGQVTAREYTHGGNGWHPHMHVLFFCTDELGPRRVVDEQWIARRWARILGELGEDADLEHGADLRPADDGAAAYVAKLAASWSIAGEIAGSLAKSGRKGSRTPAQLLDAAGRGDGRAGELYVEYVRATAGTDWLRWSPGLRHLCGLEEDAPSEEELAAAPSEEPASYLMVLTREQWKWVKANALRGDLLAQACKGDSKVLQMWLINLGLDVDDWQLDYAPGAGGP